MSLEGAESEHIHAVGENADDVYNLAKKYYGQYPYHGITDLDFIQETIGDWAERKGWNERERPQSEWCMLLVTEAAEAFEEHRNGVEPETIYFLPDNKGILKPEGPAVEHADGGKRA
jgi:hypothetical protein